MDQIRRVSTCGCIADYIHNQTQVLEDEMGHALTDGDSETIHQMRIASRRLRICIKLFKDCIPGEKLKEWQDEISRITRTLSKARDLDIQINVLKQIYESRLGVEYKPGYRRLLLRLNQERARTQEKVADIIQRLREERTLEQMREQLDEWRVGEGGVYHPPPVNFNQAEAAITHALNEFLSYQQYVHSPDNADKLHAMRIAGKNLRYTMEVFAPFYGQALLPYIQVMKQLQEELGEFHDNDVWVNWLPKFIEEEQARILDYYGDDGPVARLLPGMHHLIEDRKKAREAVYQSFLRTWEILTGENAWQVLRKILKSPVSDESAVNETVIDEKNPPEIPDREINDEHLEFEIELTPDNLDDDPDMPTAQSDPESPMKAL